MSPREFVGFLIFVDVLFTGFAIWMGVTVSVDVPYGWLFLLAGLPVWLLVRMIFFSMRGSETGLVTVDAHGIVRVVTGRRSIRRLAGRLASARPRTRRPRATCQPRSASPRPGR